MVAAAEAVVAWTVAEGVAAAVVVANQEDPHDKETGNAPTSKLSFRLVLSVEKCMVYKLLWHISLIWIKLIISLFVDSTVLLMPLFVALSGTVETTTSLGEMSAIDVKQRSLRVLVAMTEKMVCFISAYLMTDTCSTVFQCCVQMLKVLRTNFNNDRLTLAFPQDILAISGVGKKVPYQNF